MSAVLPISSADGVVDAPGPSARVPDWLDQVELAHALARGRPVDPARLRSAFVGDAATVSQQLPLRSAPERFGLGACALRPSQGCDLRVLHGLPPEVFVAAAYRRLLGREADATGWHRYVEAIEQGMSPQDVLSELSDSPEGRRAGPELGTFKPSPRWQRRIRTLWRQAAARLPQIQRQKGDSS